MKMRFWLIITVFFFSACAGSRPLVEPPPPVPAAEQPATPAVEEPVGAPSTPPAESDVLPTTAPDDWFHRDQSEGLFHGIGSAQAYETVLKGKTPARTVVVAIIDSGVDLNHEDLQNQFWTNADEIAGNGVDDDQNGYVDDRHGWNFIGGPNDTQVDADTYELTREYVRLSAKYEGLSAESIPADEREAYIHYLDIKQVYASKVQEAQTVMQNVEQFWQAYTQSSAVIKERFSVEEVTEKELNRIGPNEGMLSQAKQIFQFMEENGITPEDLTEAKEHYKKELDYRYNPNFDPRHLVGDDYSDVTERYYGNAAVIGPDPSHGTHVAGIVAANRENGVGAVGVADAVEIMVLRTVPDGDERDKDVANAIRYAADNGAHIINMSFGKDYSPHKSVVDEAVRYADSKGVLMVHAAGNDGENIDTADNFPNPFYLDGGQAQNWIEVGASSWKPGENLAADFSNYGKKSVDVFAPGVGIYSTYPGQEYRQQQGTSMAAPVVSGVAALLMAYYPDLTAGQVKEILLASAKRYPDLHVVQPGNPEAKVSFSDLSVTGAIIHVPSALRMAASMQK